MCRYQFGDFFTAPGSNVEQGWFRLVKLVGVGDGELVDQVVFGGHVQTQVLTVHGSMGPFGAAKKTKLVKPSFKMDEGVFFLLQINSF